MLVARAARLVEEIEKATGRKVGGPPVERVFGPDIPDAEDIEDAA